MIEHEIAGRPIMWLTTNLLLFAVLELVFPVSGFSLEPQSHGNFKYSYKDRAAEADRFADLTNPDFLKVTGWSKSINSNVEIYHWQYPGESIDDPDLGYREKPNAQIRHIVRTKDFMIYDAVYTFDEHSRRVTVFPKAKSFTKFIALFGCSFTYGNGLNDNETINYFIAKNNSEYFPYNYGIGATGTNTLLALSEDTDFHHQIEEKTGAFVYVFIPDHIARAAGRLPSLRWTKDTPYFVSQKEGLVRAGSFVTGRSWVTKALLWVDQHALPGSLKNRIIPPLTSSDDQYACRLVVESKKAFQRQYPGSPFIVYLHPFDLAPGIMGCLKENQIVTYQGHLPGLPANIDTYKIKYDGHPNAKANEAIAKEIIGIVKTVELGK